MLRRIKIGKRLILGFGILVLLSVVVGASALYRMFEIKANLNNISERRLPAALLVGEMNRNLLLLRVATLKLMNAATADEKSKLQQSLDITSGKYQEASKKAEVFHKTKAGRAAFEKVLNAKSAYDKIQQLLLDQINAGDLQAAHALQSSQFNQVSEQITEALSDLAEYQRHTGKKQAAMAADSLKIAEVTVVSSIAFATIAGILLAVLFSNSLVRPMRIAVAASQKIAAGDLSYQFDDHEPDEAGELIRAMAQMRQQLHNTIEAISQSASQLTTTSQDLHAITEASARTIQQQNAELDMAVTAVTELTAAVEEVAKSAAATSANSTHVDTTANDGQQQVNSTVDAIQSLERELQGSKDCILSLSRQISNIGSVMDVIRGIAEQTNLLALNAAIEAARAGESGRGFAVVADEVRALAHRTQESTKQIEDTIKAVEAETAQTVSVMGQSSKRATETLELAKHSGAAIEQITDAIGKISDQNLTIANAAEEQATVAREVDKNLLNIKDLSEQTAESAKETKNSSEQLAQLAQRLSGMVHKFKI
ncbi:methyl-accepting chemotaxis protein [Shewanella dokdonensis]|uniref:Methyl-accepting chemotaxis protein n=2 Tax=Shewanella dokdonensis TaxID=712036 RepID=A0ABX8DIZ7_9GAMM|nr:methyl-accepting chemotaxis protein [Shewanella dokdonensis]